MSTRSTAVEQRTLTFRSSVPTVTEPEDSQRPVAAAPPRLGLAWGVVSDVAYLALVAGWIMTRSWGWAAVTAVVLATELTSQGVGFQRRRAGVTGGSPPLGWSIAMVVMFVADLVLPIIAVLNWDPPWHGWVGVFLLALNVAVPLVGAYLELRRDRASRAPEG